MSISGSRVVTLQAVIENKCGECLIGVVKQEGGFVGHLEISSSLLHLNSLKRKLCRLQFFSSPSCDVNLRWLLLGFSPPFAESYFKAGKWSKTEKIKSPTYRHPAYIHTACLPQHHTLSGSKTKVSDIVWCFSFFLFFLFILSPQAQSCQTSQHFNWFPFFCACVFYFST